MAGFLILSGRSLLTSSSSLRMSIDMFPLCRIIVGVSSRSCFSSPLFFVRSSTLESLSPSLAAMKSSSSWSTLSWMATSLSSFDLFGIFGSFLSIVSSSALIFLCSSLLSSFGFCTLKSSSLLSVADVSFSFLISQIFLFLSLPPSFVSTVFLSGAVISVLIVCIVIPFSLTSFLAFCVLTDFSFCLLPFLVSA